MSHLKIEPMHLSVEALKVSILETGHTVPGIAVSPGATHFDNRRWRGFKC